MDASTVKRKPIKCPHCGKEQFIRLLAIPDKPALVIRKQAVRCLECERGFELLDEPRIVDGQFAL